MKPEKNLPELLRLMTAYQQSRVLFTFLELDIPQTLSEKKLTAAELAENLNIHPLAMDRFLNAAVSVGLLKKTKEKFVNSEMTNRFLLKGTEFFLGGQVKRQKERSYQVWENLTEKLKQWKEGESEEVPEDDDQGAEAMAEQHRLALFQGYELAKAFDFSKYKRILDLGGGTGATSIALCKTKLKQSAETLRKTICPMILTQFCWQILCRWQNRRKIRNCCKKFIANCRTKEFV
jgi:3-hydroxy-5-methyl-1-naphthoate 3-O-methyltransferase